MHPIASWTLIVALTSTTWGQAPASSNHTTLMMTGRNLTATQVAAIEQGLEANPDDLDRRIQLLGYYMVTRDNEAKKPHALWIIEHHPGSQIAGMPCAQFNMILEADGYAAANALWQKHIAARGKDAAILGNASRQYLLTDRALAIELLAKAEALEPTEPKWPARIGHAYKLSASGLGGVVHVEFAKKSLVAYERAISRSRGMTLYRNLIDATKVALWADELDKAQELAEELLSASAEVAFDFSYGNAVHHGNIVLGLVALRKDRVADAEKFLIKAGKTPGSPQLNSFGPNMRLAKELLDRGRKEAVIEYLNLCGKFWKKAQTDAWIKSIEADLTPDFGANLVY